MPRQKALRGVAGERCAYSSVACRDARPVTVLQKKVKDSFTIRLCSALLSREKRWKCAGLERAAVSVCWQPFPQAELTSDHGCLQTGLGPVLFCLLDRSDELTSSSAGLDNSEIICLLGLVSAIVCLIILAFVVGNKP